MTGPNLFSFFSIEFWIFVIWFPKNSSPKVFDCNDIDETVPRREKVYHYDSESGLKLPTRATIHGLAQLRRDDHGLHMARIHGLNSPRALSTEKGAEQRHTFVHKMKSARDETIKNQTIKESTRATSNENTALEGENSVVDKFQEHIRKLNSRLSGVAAPVILPSPLATDANLSNDVDTAKENDPVEATTDELSPGAVKQLIGERLFSRIIEHKNFLIAKRQRFNTPSFAKPGRAEKVEEKI